MGSTVQRGRIGAGVAGWLPLMLFAFFLISIVSASTAMAQVDSECPYDPDGDGARGNVFNDADAGGEGCACDNGQDFEYCKRYQVGALNVAGGVRIFCDGQAYGISANVVRCLDGMLGAMTDVFVTRIADGLGGIVTIFCTIALIVLGFKLVLGAASIKKDTVIYAAKLLLIMSFGMNASSLLTDWRGYVTGGAQAIGGLVVQGLNTVINPVPVAPPCTREDMYARPECNCYNSLNFTNAEVVFEIYDCTIASIMGSDTAKGAAVAGLVIILGLVFFAGPVGFQIALQIIMLLVTISMIAVQSVLIYVIAIIMITVLFALGPLIIPLMLFDLTKGVTESWFRHIIAYSIQPMILTTFLVLMLFAADQAGKKMTAIAKRFEELQNDPQVAKTFKLLKMQKSVSANAAAMVSTKDAPPAPGIGKIPLYSFESIKYGNGDSNWCYWDAGIRVDGESVGNIAYGSYQYGWLGSASPCDYPHVLPRTRSLDGPIFAIGHGNPVYAVADGIVIYTNGDPTCPPGVGGGVVNERMHPNFPYYYHSTGNIIIIKHVSTTDRVTPVATDGRVYYSVYAGLAGKTKRCGDTVTGPYRKEDGGVEYGTVIGDTGESGNIFGDDTYLDFAIYDGGVTGNSTVPVDTSEYNSSGARVPHTAQMFTPVNLFSVLPAPRENLHMFSQQAEQAGDSLEYAGTQLENAAKDFLNAIGPNLEIKYLDIGHPRFINLVMQLIAALLAIIILFMAMFGFLEKMPEFTDNLLGVTPIANSIPSAGQMAQGLQQAATTLATGGAMAAGMAAGMAQRFGGGGDGKKER